MTKKTVILVSFTFAFITGPALTLAMEQEKEKAKPSPTLAKVIVHRQEQARKQSSKKEKPPVACFFYSPCGAGARMRAIQEQEPSDCQSSTNPDEETEFNYFP